MTTVSAICVECGSDYKYRAGARTARAQFCSVSCKAIWWARQNGGAPNFTDLTSQVFGFRTVLGFEGISGEGKKKKAKWRVQCLCGRVTITTTSNLKLSKSCGCDGKGAKQSGLTRRTTNPRYLQPDASKRDHLKRTFGITLEYWKEMIRAQNNQCEICKRPFGQHVIASVDHCHETGAIRSLLCRRCNAGIGGLRDSIPLVESALRYLKRFAK